MGQATFPLTLCQHNTASKHTHIVNTPNKPPVTMAFISTTPVTRLRIEQADPKPERKTEYVWKPGNKRMVRENISLR